MELSWQSLTGQRESARGFNVRLQHDPFCYVETETRVARSEDVDPDTISEEMYLFSIDEKDEGWGKCCLQPGSVVHIGSGGASSQFLETDSMSVFQGYEYASSFALFPVQWILEQTSQGRQYFATQKIQRKAEVGLGRVQIWVNRLMTCSLLVYWLDITHYGLALQKQTSRSVMNWDISDPEPSGILKHLSHDHSGPITAGYSCYDESLKLVTCL